MPRKQKSKLRILAASDTHGDPATMKRLSEKAEKENADLVVLCGDITSPLESKNIIKPFKDKNQEVIIIPGNHDSLATTDFLANIYNATNLHGYSIIHENIGFFGAGGAEGPGHTTPSDKEMLEVLKKAHSGLKGIEKKIMITHQHPSESTSEFSGVEGSKAITKAIKKFKPIILIHGHIHEAHGIEEKIGKTKVFNVGRKGKIIEV